MGCKYCKEDNVIFRQERIAPCSWGWGGDTKITEGEAVTFPLGVFLDRGYLRLVDLDDCNCMDHGEKIKIEFHKDYIQNLEN